MDSSTSNEHNNASNQGDKVKATLQSAQNEDQLTTLGYKKCDKEDSYSGLDELCKGVKSTIKVLVHRKWDATNPFGKYISTEYIVFDQKGNTIHCTARSNISHCFLSKLEEGNIYSLRNFTVRPNKETFRLRNNDTHIIELEGNTIVNKIECKVHGFLRYPFQLIPIEDITLNGCKYLIDVIGCVTNVGKVKLSKTGSQYLDFHLINERGARIRVTLWDPLCDDLVKSTDRPESIYAAIFPRMNVKEFRSMPPNFHS